MKNKMLSLFLLLLFLTAQAKEFRLGGGFGGSIFQRDLRHHWVNAPRFGLDFYYPLAPRLPLVFSIYGSQHDPIDQSTNGNKYKQVHHNVLLLTVDLMLEFELMRERAFQPLLGTGFTSTTMIAYTSWPPKSNNDESEIGYIAQCGVRKKFGPKVQLDVLYKQHVLFTEPRFLNTGSLITRITVPIRRRNRDEN